MIRQSRVSLKFTNKSKIEKFDYLTQEMLRVINIFVNELWKQQNFSSKFIDFKVDTFLSARMQQCLGKQALENVKSQRKKKNKTMPIIKNISFNIDNRFFDLKQGNYFDMFLRFKSLGNKTFFNIPIKLHKHYNNLIQKGFKLKNSIRLLKIKNQYYIDFIFKKKEEELTSIGNVVGFDCGYKKLLVSSNGDYIGQDFENIYKNISNKKQGSNAFKRSLKQRDNKINEILNCLDLSNIKEVVVEDLKNVKHKSKLRKKFNNKLQRWSYPKVLVKLSRLCEEKGILFTKVNPRYTSQKCSCCGLIQKNNRKGEKYECSCGNVMDADLNAAINISLMGVYSPHTSRNIFI